MYTLIPNPDNEKSLVLHENGQYKHCPHQSAFGIQNKFGATQLVKHPCESLCALFKISEMDVPEVAGAAETNEPQPTFLLVTQHCTPNDATHKVELVEPHTETAMIIAK